MTGAMGNVHVTTGGSDEPKSAMTLVDGHGHLHACFPQEHFFTSTWKNFHRAAESATRVGTETIDFALVLLDGGGDPGHPFARLRDAGVAALPGGWRIEATEEATSMRVGRDGAEQELYLVAGRQIPTREGLEVLAVPSLDEFVHGQPVQRTIREVLDRGVLAILPWGFGKWWLRRKAVVESLVASPLGERVFLGDNGNRPRHAPPPAAFRMGEARGRPVLPGSDPLPIPGHSLRAGSWGFVLDGALRPTNPAMDLERRIRELKASPTPFGQRATLAACLVANFELRVRGRRSLRT